MIPASLPAASPISLIRAASLCGLVDRVVVVNLNPLQKKLLVPTIWRRNKMRDKFDVEFSGFSDSYKYLNNGITIGFKIGSNDVHVYPEVSFISWKGGGRYSLFGPGQALVCAPFIKAAKAINKAGKLNR